ncbi:MAG TPA: TonB-dependent receptor [Gemmatimonadales bacterium]|jgi:iron complex outermembrane receptor protein
MLAALLLALQQTPADTTQQQKVVGVVDHLYPIVVTAPASRPLTTLAPSGEMVDRRSRPARADEGLDELLSDVSGVYDANRYNFSLDQRLSIRGFGARSSFGVRGIKIYLDGIPQTLPDGSAQLTNVEFGSLSRVEILRGASSALYGNASGGVISLESNDSTATGFSQDVEALGGSLSSKILSTTRARIGSGTASLVASRLRFTGFRQHSDADLRNLNGRYVLRTGSTILAATADYGDDPRADNPGALTSAELAANRDSAAAINITRAAGKNVHQFQGGLSLRYFDAAGDELSVAVFGFSRHLVNPQTFAWIDLDRLAYGARVAYTHWFRLSAPLALTVGLDAQRQRDSRLNVGNPNGSPDTVRQLDQLEHVTEVGPFGQADLQLRPFRFLAGVRDDQVTFAVDDRLIAPTNPDDSGRRVMQSPSWSLGASWQQPGLAQVYVNAGTSFETPTTTELANRPDTAGGFNAALNPQRALEYEIGLRSHTRVQWSLAFFRAEVRDELIAYAILASPGRVFYQNAGHSRHQGVEASAGWWVGHGVTLRASWTFSDFRYTDYTTHGYVLDGLRVPGIPQHWAHLSATYRARGDRGLFVQLEETISSSVLVDDTLSTISSGWTTLDVRAGWDGAVGRVRLSPFLAINNALDRHYVSSVVINAANGRYFEPAPGRNLYVGLTIGAR